MIQETNPEHVNRQEAIELFIKAMAATPGLITQSADGGTAAIKILAGADFLMTYILEGKKP